MKWLLRLAIGLPLLLSIILVALYYILNTHYWLAPASKDAVQLIVEPGTSSQRIISMLDEKKVIQHPLLFKVFAYHHGQLAKFKAGEYALAAGLSPADIATLLEQGKSLQHRVTVAEGLTVTQILALVKDQPLLVGDITNIPLEGELLPDTYFFMRGTKRQVIIEHMQASMRAMLQKAWDMRQLDLPLHTMQEALILASIVEKETGAHDEREKVAAVFINRLRRGMKLQSDPTANYGLYLRSGTLKKRMLLADVADKSAYNTYVIDGLPPTPICNPGAAAINAVLHPADSTALFFVANGEGGHIFADTLAEHNRNVKKYHALMREKRRVLQ